jgi:hypothetical protein
VYAFAGRKTCTEPPLTDFNQADLQAWGNCNSDNGTHLATFLLLGLGAAALGMAGAGAIYPSHADVLSLVNEHNRLSHEPMRLQLGFDPTSRLAMGGLSAAF